RPVTSSQRCKSLYRHTSTNSNVQRLRRGKTWNHERIHEPTLKHASGNLVAPGEARGHITHGGEQWTATVRSSRSVPPQSSPTCIRKHCASTTESGSWCRSAPAVAPDATVSKI